MTAQTLKDTLLPWLAALDVANHYEVLGVLPIADDLAIQDAFHAFAESFHPDRHRAEDEATRKDLARIFRSGAEAYRILRRAGLRSSYDLELAKAQGRGETDIGQRGASSLDELCVTPAGRLFARRAERAILDGDLSRAEELLLQCVLAEGPNVALAERREAHLEALRELRGLGDE